MSKNWESVFESKIATIASSEDPAHDLNHFKRVVTMAKKLCAQEKAISEVVIPAAWLHDFVIVPKNSPLRSQASRMSAVAALEFLKEINYPEQFHEAIAHAIEGHSFSANIEIKTLEAQIVQDADRLDGLGAIGIARCFATAGLMKRSFYNSDDPFCENRNPDDQNYTIDHFYQKLFKTAETLKTQSGKAEAKARIHFMQQYLSALGSEIL
ncbi:hydrolase [Bdellovibrio sp. qaytius]|nr:hydrolase [Bdellovibrio sp. qaytius]